MTGRFHDLQQDYYHRVAVGPFERPTTSLVGSDIVLHLPVIEYFASLCRHCTEFGVREGHSTVALIAGCKGKVVSYDIEHTPVVDLLRAIPLPCASWEFRPADTGSVRLEIEETDFLFIDTLHTYDHVRKELTLHGRKARRFLGFHDTFTCGERDLSGPDPSARGIMPAVREFLAAHPGEYRVAYETKANNGMTVYERLDGTR